MDIYHSVSEFMLSFGALLSAAVFTPAAIEHKDVGDAFSSQEFNQMLGSVRLFYLDDNDTEANASDDKLGIGTNTPDYKLDIAGDIRATGDIHVTKIYGDGSGLTNVGGAGVGNWIKTVDDINYPDGKVGVGAGTPDYYLDIKKTGTDVFHIGSDAGSDLHVDVGGSLGLVNLVAGAEFDTDHYSYTGSRGAARLKLHDGALNLTTGDTNAGSAGTSVSWNTGLHMDKEGEVGIGTTNPQYQLDVNGGSLSVVAPEGNDLSARLSSADAENYLELQTTHVSPVMVGTRILSGSTVVASQEYDMANNRWDIYAGTDAPSGRIMSLKNNGRVGVGLTNPDEMFHVNGNVAWGSGRLKTDEGGSLELGDAGSNPYIDFKNDATSDYDVRLSLIGNDTLEIAGGTLSAPDPVQPTEVATKSYVDNRTAFCEVTNTAVVDANDIAGETITFNTTALHRSDASLFTPLSTGVQVAESGVYEIQTNVYMTSGTARTNVALEFTINGTTQGIRGAGAYIRKTDGHNESSGHLSQILTLSANDIVGVTSTQLATAGAVTIPAAQSNLIIKKLQ